MPLSIQVSQQPKAGGVTATVIKLAGLMDSTTSPGAEKELAPILAAASSVVEIDLGGVTFISSAGLGVLIYATKTLVARGAQCYVTNPQPQIKKVFEIVKAVRGMSLFSSTKEMDEYLSAIQRKVTGGG